MCMYELHDDVFTNWRYANVPGTLLIRHIQEIVRPRQEICGSVENCSDGYVHRIFRSGFHYAITPRYLLGLRSDLLFLFSRDNNCLLLSHAHAAANYAETTISVFNRNWPYCS
jgi:hypothetical protein